MRVLEFIGKALLIVILPVAFCVVSSIIITALISSIGALIGHDTFQTCFQSGLEITVTIMAFVSVLGTLFYFASEEES